MIGERIQQARKASGLSMRALAEKAGISAMAISKYESNKSTPSSGVLLSLSKALGVRSEYFFRRVSVKLENINHREHEKLPAKEEQKVFADTEEQLERWIALEEFVPAPWSKPFELPTNIVDHISTYDEIEDVANQLRSHWNLGQNPIAGLIDMLETKGIKVFITQYDGHKNFNGLSATANGAPVIVVGQTWPGDRQRFTLAHELGHLVLHGRLNKELDVEVACHRFAGAFLVPKDMVFKALGEHRTWLEPQELMLLKHEWGLSMQAWTYRALNLKITTKEAHKDVWRNYMRKWKESEPDPQYPKEATRLFPQLVFRALAENLLGESKAAELLGMSVVNLHACRKLECPDDMGGYSNKISWIKWAYNTSDTSIKRDTKTGKVINNKNTGKTQARNNTKRT